MIIFVKCFLIYKIMWVRKLIINYSLSLIVFAKKMYQTRVSIFKVLKLYLFYFTTKHLPSKTWATPLVLSMVFFCFCSRDKFVYWGGGLVNLRLFLSPLRSVFPLVTSPETPLSINDPRVVHSSCLSLTVNSISIEANTYSSFSFSSSRSKKTSGSNENPREKIGSSSTILKI